MHMVVPASLLFINSFFLLHDVLQQDLNPYKRSVSEQEVCRQFKKMNTAKAAGPDGISAQVLQSCSISFLELLPLFLTYLLVADLPTIL